MPRAPLLNIELTNIPRRLSSASTQASPIDDRPSKPWTAYIPLAIAVLLVLMPQPSFVLLIINQHYRTYEAPWTAARHLVLTTILTLLTFSSLIVCCVRDPGRPRIGETVEIIIPERQSLIQGKDGDDFNSSRKWCRACWAPKHERTHHCSTCGRCVLKMDHHCPWLANKCIGHRTYPAFLHLLLCITLLALYMGTVAVSTIYWYLFAPFPQTLDDPTPLHALFLSIMGMIFSLTFASFLGFHVYLCLTNQTTLENLSPFLLLRYLPAPNLNSRHVPGTSITTISADTLETMPDSPYHFPPPPPSPFPVPLGTQNRTMNRPWEEHELSYAQRRAIRRAHGRIRLYDVGWRNNLEQVFGRSLSLAAFLAILLYGGKPKGDGKRFELNHGAQSMLEDLADELVKIRERERGGSANRDATHSVDGCD